MNNLTKKSIPEMAIDTRLLLQRLLKAKVGDVLTYKELNGVISRDVQRDANPCLQSAMRAALRQQMVFSTLRGIGVKRLTDRELAGIGEAARQHIARSARVAMKKMTHVQDFKALTNDEKIRHNTGLAMLGAVAHIASPKNAKALEGRVSNSFSVLPVQKTLAAFMGKDAGEPTAALAESISAPAEQQRVVTKTQATRPRLTWDFSKENL